MKTGRMRLGYRLVRWIAGSLYKLVFGVRIFGIENVPLEGKILLVSNHVSNLDPPLVGSSVPREIYFAAKIELFKGLLGKLITYLNSIPVRRSGSDKEAIRTMAAALSSGGALLIFPQGTRTLDPDSASLKAGVGMLALKSNADLLPVRVDGTGNLKEAFLRKQKVSVTFGPVIRLSELLADNHSRKEAYGRIAEAMMKEIEKMKRD